MREDLKKPYGDYPIEYQWYAGILPLAVIAVAALLPAFFPRITMSTILRALGFGANLKQVEHDDQEDDPTEVWRICNVLHDEGWRFGFSW